MSVFDEKYLMAEVASLSGLPKGKFQLWHGRYSITGAGHSPDGGGKQGAPRTFSFNHVMEFALAKEFVEAGASPSMAFEFTPFFAYTGGEAFETTPERWPGLPFHPEHGRTLFAINAKRHWIGCWEPSKPGVLSEVFNALANHFVMVNASTVFLRVCNRMGRHPYEILDEEYTRRSSI